jgi:hypothetical protein|nr:MAG TPA: hypothetical protein [Caudoviricetes sp.]
MNYDRYNQFEQTFYALKYKLAIEKLELFNILDELNNVFEYDLIHSSDFLKDYNEMLDSAQMHYKIKEFLFLEKYLNDNVSTMKLSLKAKRYQIEFNFKKLEIELNKLEKFYLNKSAEFDELKNINEKIIIEFIDTLKISNNKIIEMLKLDRELDNLYLINEI